MDLKSVFFTDISKTKGKTPMTDIFSFHQVWFRRTLFYFKIKTTLVPSSTIVRQKRTLQLIRQYHTDEFSFPQSVKPTV